MADESRNSGKDRTWARFGTRLSVMYSPAGSPAGTASEARVLDLSGAGVRFRTERELRAGDHLDLKLMFPGEPMSVSGKVVRVLPREERGVSSYEIAAAFLNLTENEHDRIDMWFFREKIAAADDDEASTGGERRRSERFEVVKAYAEIRKKGIFSAKKWQRGIIKQISRHGALMMVKSPLSFGDRVEALLRLPAYDEPLRIIAKVVRVKSNDPNLCLFYRREIGLEFIKISKRDLNRLSGDEYLQSLIERSDSEFI